MCVRMLNLMSSLKTHQVKILFQLFFFKQKEFVFKRIFIFLIILINLLISLPSNALKKNTHEISKKIPSIKRSPSSEVYQSSSSGSSLEPSSLPSAKATNSTAPQIGPVFSMGMPHLINFGVFVDKPLQWQISTHFGMTPISIQSYQSVFSNLSFRYAHYATAHLLLGSKIGYFQADVLRHEMLSYNDSQLSISGQLAVYGKAKVQTLFMSPFIGGHWRITEKLHLFFDSGLYIPLYVKSKVTIGGDEFVESLITLYKQYGNYDELEKNAQHAASSVGMTYLPYLTLYCAWFF